MSKLVLLRLGGVSQEAYGSPWVGGCARRRIADDMTSCRHSPLLSEMASLKPQPLQRARRDPGDRSWVLVGMSPQCRGGHGVPVGSGAEQTVLIACLGHVRFAPRGVCRGTGKKIQKIEAVCLKLA